MIKFEKCVYRCKTKKIGKELLREFEKANITWADGDKATKCNIQNDYDEYNNMCIYYNGGYIRHCPLKYYKSNNYKIIDAGKFLIDNYLQNKILEYIDSMIYNSTINYTNKNINNLCNHTENAIEYINNAIKKLSEIKNEYISNKFVPYLKDFHDNHYGNIGEKSDIEDVLGNKLKVGDTVNMYIDKNKFGEYAICYTKERGFFLYVNSKFKFINRTYKDNIETSYIIIKNRSYTEMQNNDIINDVKYIKSEEK